MGSEAWARGKDQGHREETLRLATPGEPMGPLQGGERMQAETDCLKDIWGQRKGDEKDEARWALAMTEQRKGSRKT